MLRQRLITTRGLVLTEDTARALVDLEQKVTAAGWRLNVFGPRPDTLYEEESLTPAGREVHLRLDQPGKETDAQTALNALWGHAIPLGFTPLIRYPRAVSLNTEVFHFLGPWGVVLSRLLSEGRGHLAWPSVCCAAQVDTGTWKGDREVERFVQAQLHRLGHNCGPVDGVIGPRTMEVINRLGLANVSLVQLAEHFRQALSPSVAAQARQTGHIAVQGRRLNVATFGGVRSVLTLQGATLHIDGPGRVIVDIGEVS